MAIGGTESGRAPANNVNMKESRWGCGVLQLEQVWQPDSGVRVKMQCLDVPVVGRLDLSG